MESVRKTFFRAVDALVFDAFKDIMVYRNQPVNSCVRVPCHFGTHSSREDIVDSMALFVVPEMPMLINRPWWCRFMDRLLHNRNVFIKRLYRIEIYTLYFEDMNQITEQIFSSFGNVPRKLSVGTMALDGTLADRSYNAPVRHGELRSMTVLMNFKGWIPAQQ